MSYTNKTLMPDEQVLFHSKQHLIIFTSAAIWLIISLLIFTLCRGWSFFNTILFGHAVYFWIGLIALFITAMHGLSAYLKYLATEYAVTSKRILMKTGLIHHKTLEIFLTKIESVHASQNIIGRLLDFGTVTISSSGGNKETFPSVPKPMEFRKIIHEQIHR